MAQRILQPVTKQTNCLNNVETNHPMIIVVNKTQREYFIREPRCIERDTKGFYGPSGYWQPADQIVWLEHSPIRVQSIVGKNYVFVDLMEQ